MITAITIDTLTKFFLWKEIDYLGENSLALVHGEAPFASFYAKKTTNPGLWQIQIDPFQIRQYLKCLHMVTLCSKNLNRTVVISYIQKVTIGIIDTTIFIFVKLFLHSQLCPNFCDLVIFISSVLIDTTN